MTATQLQDLQEALVLVFAPWVGVFISLFMALGFFGAIGWIMMSYLSIMFRGK